MKILQVNQFYYPRGGADKYFLDLTRALEQAGHTVAVFSMTHPKNWPSPWSDYFVSRVSFNEPTWRDRLKTTGRVLYSREAKRKFARLVRDFKPDIIHLHNIYHHISPSILDVSRQHKIPVVMHLHDYKLVCANHAMFNNGKFCDCCGPHNYYKCIAERCIKNSFGASLLATIEMYLHHSILHIYERSIDKFIAPSRFMKETVARYGQEAAKVEVIYNPYNPELISETVADPAMANGGYLLYFGRLSEEKGLLTLIEAAALTGQAVKLAGSGPAEESLKKLARGLKAPVEFIGFKNSAALAPLIRLARAVVLPSIWAENMPLSLLEALSLGKVTIVSRIGGLPEVITDGVNGLLFNPGDSVDLARQIKRLDELDLAGLAQNAKVTAEKFSPARNLAEILALYHRLVK